MKGERVKEWVTERETGNYHQKCLVKDRTGEKRNNWVESSIRNVRSGGMKEYEGREDEGG